MGTFFAEMSSWTALTGHKGIKTVFQTKSINSKYLGLTMKILKFWRLYGRKCILKETKQLETHKIWF